MHRWIALPAVVVLCGIAACSGQDDVDGQGDQGVETAAPGVELADAIAVAQRSMPVDLPDSRVGILLEDLCGGVPADLRGLALSDQTQVDAAVGALEAGTDDLCPADVTPALLEDVRTAAAPPPTGAGGAAATTGGPQGGAAGAGGDGTAAVGSGGSAATATNGSSSGGAPAGAANSSAGSAATGGGDATGTGNASSSDVTQSVGSGSSGSSSSSNGASNDSSVGSP